MVGLFPKSPSPGRGPVARHFADVEHVDAHGFGLFAGCGPEHSPDR